MLTTHLRIEIAGGPINVYRITDRDLEFRSLDPTGCRLDDQRGTWRRLTANELVLHFRLNTVVANWFLEKMDEVEKKEIKSNGTPECRVRTSNTTTTFHSCRIIVPAA